jgi:hypothetical protein
MENLSPIIPLKGMLPWKKASNEFRRKKNRKKKPDSNAKNNFFALSQLADDNHLGQVAKESNIRLCVYRKENDIFMDVVTINKTQKNKYYNRAITHDDIGKLVRQIHSGNGLVVDYSV